MGWSLVVMGQTSRSVGRCYAFGEVDRALGPWGLQGKDSV